MSTGAYIFVGNVVRVALRVVSQGFCNPTPLGVGLLTIATSY